MSITICDSSVLINFLKIDRIDLFEKTSHSFFITDHVQNEITVEFPEQLSRLTSALDRKIIQITNVGNDREFEIFAALSKSGQLGPGESAAIAVASFRGTFLAIDDNQAIKKASSFLHSSYILRIQDLLLIMIKEQILDIESADQIIQTWASQHRFKLKISTIGELINEPVVY